MTSKELEALEFIKLDYGVEPKGYELIKSALEVLEQFEILKNYYEPFKQFLNEQLDQFVEMSMGKEEDDCGK